MKKISLVTEETLKLHQEQTFSDLKLDLEKKLIAARSETDVSELLSDVNHILQMSELSSKNKIELKNFRQKAYDKKRKLQGCENRDTSFQENIENGLAGPELHLSMNRLIQPHQSEKSIPEQCMGYLRRIDFEKVLVKMPVFILFASCSILTMWFVWSQSVPLYESVGFSDPKFCAFGAILMIAGFSLIHSITKSKIVLLLCLYASTYEVILIINGTMKHEAIQSESKIEQNTELTWLSEQSKYSGDNYRAIKAKFEDPSSKVFKNSWYKEKYVDPAWVKYSDAQNTLAKKRDKLMSENSNYDRIGMLKILFRLGLVFLCMVSIHQLLKLFSSNTKMNHSYQKTG